MASISRARASRSARGTPRFSRPNVTLSRTVRHGNSACSWKTIAVSGVPGRSASIRTAPALWRRRPATTRNSVDFPLPLGPTMQRNSPACACSEIRSSARTERPWLSKVTLTSFTRTLGTGGGIGLRATGAERGRAGLTSRPVTSALLQMLDSRPADLRVVGGEDTGDPPPADELAVDDDRKPALERARAGKLEDSQVHTTLPEGVLERLGWPAEGDGRVRLVFRDIDAAELCAVHPMQHHEVATRVKDGDDDVPVVLLRLGLGARHDFLGLLEADRGAVRRRRWRRCRGRLLSSCERCRQDQRHAEHQGQQPFDSHGSPPCEWTLGCRGFPLGETVTPRRRGWSARG